MEGQPQCRWQTQIPGGALESGGISMTRSIWQLVIGSEAQGRQGAEPAGAESFDRGGSRVLMISSPFFGMRILSFHCERAREAKNSQAKPMDMHDTFHGKPERETSHSHFRRAKGRIYC